MGEMIENYGVWLQAAGLLLVFAGWLWIVTKAFRDKVAWGIATLFPPMAVFYGLIRGAKLWLPMATLALGIFLVAFPPAYSRLAPVDLGPRDKLVSGERHITITGWDGSDYAGALGTWKDATVLQMANSDVDDRTLELLKGFEQLKELDVSNSKVTDAGLYVLADLPALATLRLKNTKITDRGFRDALSAKESLQRLDLGGTEVTAETVDAWKNAKEGRRALR